MLVMIIIFHILFLGYENVIALPSAANYVQFTNAIKVFNFILLGSRIGLFEKADPMPTSLKKNLHYQSTYQILERHFTFSVSPKNIYYFEVYANL